MHWEMWARFDLCTITCMKITWLASLPAEIYKSCKWEDIFSLLFSYSVLQLSQTSVIHLFYYSTILSLKHSSSFHFSTSYSTFFPFYYSWQVYLYLCNPSILYILPLHSTSSSTHYIYLRGHILVLCDFSPPNSSAMSSSRGLLWRPGVFGERATSLPLHNIHI